MSNETAIERAFELLDINSKQAKQLFQAVLKEDKTNGDAAFGLVLCLADEKDFEFDELVNLLQVVTASDSIFKVQAQEFLEEIISPEDLDLFNKLEALVNKATELDEIFDTFQNSSGELQDKCIENRLNEMLDEIQDISDAFTENDLDKIQDAISAENF